MIEVEWTQMQMQSGAPLERWHARLVKPFRSQEFALLAKRDGWWHLDLMLTDLHLNDVARYRKREQAIRQVGRWIASRWQRLQPEVS